MGHPSHMAHLHPILAENPFIMARAWAVALLLCALLGAEAKLQRVQMQRVEPTQLRATATRPYLKSMLGSKNNEAADVPLSNFLDAQVICKTPACHLCPDSQACLKSTPWCFMIAVLRRNRVGHSTTEIQRNLRYGYV